jgi:hypothetical protein
MRAFLIDVSLQLSAGKRAIWPEALIEKQLGLEKQAMKGSAEEKASGSERKRWEDYILTWGTARNMLPLTRRIVRDIIESQKRLPLLHRDKSLLDSQHAKLAWRERARRYEIQEEIQGLERQIADARAELERLGVVLLSDSDGEVGFPTLVNDCRAFFVWKPSEETLEFWQFAGESARRAIPAAWTKIPDSEVQARR